MRHKFSFFGLILTLLCPFILGGCIYEYNPDISQTPPADIAIGGDIVIGGVSRFNISNVLSVPDDESKTKFPFVNVFVECEDGTSLPAEGIGSGTYTVDCSDLDPALSYRVRVKTTEGKNYCSAWSKVSADPVIDDVKYTWDEDHIYVWVDLSSSDGGEGYYRIDYDEVWQYHADFIPDYMYNIEYISQSGIITEKPEFIYRKRLAEEDYYYCWRTAESTEYVLANTLGREGGKIKEKQVTSFARTSQRCMTTYCINLKVCSLDWNAYAYLENTQKTANTTGDLFTPVPSEMRGNVFNENDENELVYGYVTTSKVATHRFFIRGSKHYIQKYNPESSLYFPEINTKTGEYGYYELYSKGDRPVRVYEPQAVDIPSPTNTNVLWGPGRCTDCRYDGGTKNKPDYWPNNDK